MKHLSVNKWFLTIASISFLNVACQGNMKSGLAAGATDNGSLSTPQDVTNAVDMKAIEDIVASSQASVAQAQVELDKISNKDGSIKIWSLISSGSSEVQSQGLFDIGAKLTQVLDKIVDTVKLAKGKFTDARVLLATQAAKLDPANPAHAAVLAQINVMMSKIDLAESRFSTVIHTLASRLDLVNRGIDIFVASASASNPIFAIVLPMLTGQIKMAITDFQAKLSAI